MASGFRVSGLKFRSVGRGALWVGGGFSRPAYGLLGASCSEVVGLQPFGILRSNI